MSTAVADTPKRKWITNAKTYKSEKSVKLLTIEHMIHPSPEQ